MPTPLVIIRRTPDPELILREKMEAQHLRQQGMGEREASEGARRKHLPVPQ